MLILMSTTSDYSSKLNQLAARGAIAAIAWQALLTVIQFINIVVFSRLLKPADFGLYAMATTVIAFAALFRDLGLSAATIQRENLDHDTASGLFFVNIGAALVLMFLVCAAAPFAALALNDSRLTLTIVFLSGTLPIAALGAQHTAQFARDLQFFNVQWIAVAGAVAGSVGALFLAATGGGHWALLANAWIGATCQMILLWMWSPWRPSRVRDWSGVRSALKFGGSVTVSGLITYFCRQFDKLLVGYRWGGEELGYYSRAYVILLIPQTLVSGPISSVLIPTLSRLQSQSEEWRSLLVSGVRITTTFSMLVATLLIANGDDIVRIMLGPQWESSADMVAIFGISMIARAVMNQNPWIYLSLGHTKRMLAWQLTALPMYLGGIVIGLSYGVEGVAFGFSLAQLALCVPSVFIAAAGTPVSGASILRIIFPMGVVAFITILASTSLSITIKGEENDVIVSVFNLVITGSVFGIGTVFVLCIDPEYHQLRDLMVRWRGKVGFIVIRGMGKLHF